ncbi:hypothetical protein [uncultured Tateyamaria sp.]|uniref:hypothetical protein n=1 Tax=uncultured Tateyamaria sp. TaxID=455651 RepID=UPI00262DE382|nr:hypothetical protein [uncultured Tateyamaria sp.]
MSNAVRIFTHAFTMVFHDLGATLRATYVGVSLVALSVVLFLTLAPNMFGSMMLATETDAFNPDAFGNAGAAVVAILVMAVGYIMMVAAWHRYVLLPEGQRDGGFTPGAGIVLGYFGRSLLLGIIVGIAAIPLFVPLGVIASAGNDILTNLVAIPLFAILGWVLLRLSLILPACTIGKDMKLTESWAASRPLSGAIIGLTIILGVVDFVLNLVISALPAPYILGVVSVITSVLFALVSASILTTLYGIAVEGREV